MPRRDRTDHVADELERVARELRAGDAVLYGYDVQHEPPPSTESGGISYSGGWLSFEIEER